MDHPLISKNNINITGQGENVILFIHGFGCDQTMWRFIAPSFEKDHTVVLLDLVGCGASDTTAYEFDKYSSLNGYVADIIEICDVFNLKNITLVGHSVSAMIAGLTTIQRPDLFRNLIMVCPSPRYINEASTGYLGGFNQSDITEMIETLTDNYLGWSSAIAPVIIGHADNPEFTNELTNSFCRNNPEIATHFAKLTFSGDNRQDLKAIKLPTLILQSRHDVLAPLEVGVYVHEHIAGSTLKVLNTNGHCPHLTTPEATLALMVDFVQDNAFSGHHG